MELRKDDNRIVLTVDKGVDMVVIDKKDYIDKATNLLSQPAIGPLTGTSQISSRENLLLSLGM